MTVTSLNQETPMRRRVSSFKSKPIFISILILAGYGCVMITSATMGIEAGDYSALISTIAKQILFVGAGWIAMHVATTRFRLKLLTSNGFLNVLVVGTGIALVMPLAFPAVSGAHAWIQLGPLGSLQPSEFAKVSLILVIAAYLGDQSSASFKQYKHCYNVALGFSIMFVAIVVVVQGDFGSGMVMAMILFVCLLVPQSPRISHVHRLQKRLFILGVIVVLVILISPFGESIVDMIPLLKDYQKARIFSARDPFVDQYNTGYQLINGLVAFASGGFTGVGFGNSVRKFMNFPAANTDYILSIIVEELGFLGFLIVLIPYGVILYQLFHYAFKMKSEKGRIILIGVATYLVVHFLFNVGGETGLIPLTGVPLLMLSQGGSSAAATMLAIGVAQAVICRYNMGEIH